jgi:hypothetical protein
MRDDAPLRQRLDSLAAAIETTRQMVEAEQERERTRLAALAADLGRAHEDTTAARRVVLEAEAAIAAVEEAAREGACPDAVDALRRLALAAPWRARGDLEGAVARRCLEEGDVETAATLAESSGVAEDSPDAGETWLYRVTAHLSRRRCDAASDAWNAGVGESGASPPAGVEAVWALGVQVCGFRAVEERASGGGSGRSRRRSGGGGSVRCCDGTISPTCTCGDLQGCCSHHRGVCGCTD